MGTADGFTFDIANYDPAFTYAVSATGGTVVIDSNGHVTVTGLAPATASTVTGHRDPRRLHDQHGEHDRELAGHRHSPGGVDPGRDRRRVHLRPAQLRSRNDLHGHGHGRRDGNDGTTAAM